MAKHQEVSCERASRPQQLEKPKVSILEQSSEVAFLYILHHKAVELEERFLTMRIPVSAECQCTNSGNSGEA